ncbi:MAG: alpha/beta fold hydrolase [Phycisphaerae bacterium]|nr:alpha/beta fold hydrolase [Phycisphaerae bacterium]
MTEAAGLLLLGAVALLLLLCVLVWGIVWDARHPPRATAGWALANGFPAHPADVGWQASDEVWSGPLPAFRVVGNNPSGPVAVFVHGWRRSRIDSMRRAGIWIPRIRAAWLIDLAGHGDSPKGPTHLGASDVEMIVRFCGDLVAREGAGTRLVLIGHSLGAAITLRVAALLPKDTLAGAVAFAPYESVLEPISNRLRRQGLPVWPAAVCSTAALRALCGRERSTSAAVATLHAQGIPMLIVASAADTHVPLSHVQRVAGTLGNQVIVEPSISHDAIGTGPTPHADSPSEIAAREFSAHW